MKFAIIGLRLVFLFSLFLANSSCNGQKLAKTNQNNTDDFRLEIGDTVSGLGKSIYCIFQDSKNNFWFGSNEDGVYRYDGKTLLYFTTKHGLANKVIREIKEDKTGNIYFSTQAGGISKFDGQKFTTLTVTKSDSPKNDWKLQKHDLWFKGETGKNGPYRYDGKNLYSLEFPKHFMADDYYKLFPNMPWSPYEIYSIYHDRKGHIWFGTSNFGICRFDGKSLSWLYEDHLTNIAGGGSFGIRSILEDKTGKFWFCNTSYRYDISDSVVNDGKTSNIHYKREAGIDNFKAPEGKSMIYYLSAIEDNSGNMWMVTYEQGVWKYDGKNMTRFAVKDGEKDFKLFSIYKDKKGDLWIGTQDDGVYKFDGKSFKKFTIK